MLFLKDVSKPELCFNGGVCKTSEINFFFKEPSSSHVFFHQDTAQGWKTIQFYSPEGWTP